MLKLRVIDFRKFNDNNEGNNMKQKNGVYRKIVNLIDKHPSNPPFFAIVIIPLLLQFLLWCTTYFHVFTASTIDGWLGFWGSYLGSIAAISGVYC